MNVEIIRFLKSYSTNEYKANSLIVSSFLGRANLSSIRNQLIKKYIIPAGSKDKNKLVAFNKIIEKHKIDFNLELLVELFEFVISPKDKIVNGAVYTPKNIRDFIVSEIVRRYTGSLATTRACDFSVGCGGFLFSMAQAIRAKTKRPYSEIFKENLYGLDITPYSIERTKILLSLLAICDGEDRSSYEFNLEEGNALSFDWKNEHTAISKNGGFNIVLGNPPYVCSRNISKKSFDLLSKWTVCKTGHPDLYIPFFQIGYENLTSQGILGYITVNTFFKSINGRALREYFSEKKPHLRIINFGGEQIFKNRNTYTCLCFVEKGAPSRIEYRLAKSDSLSQLDERDFNVYQYGSFNDTDGWNLVNSKKEDSLIRLIENTGTKFKTLYTTRNGIATLKNKIYKFKPYKENKTYYYFQSYCGKDCKVEKVICRDIVNSNRIKSEQDLAANIEKIIFPYWFKNDKAILISERELRKKCPHAWNYLLDNKESLATRDKGEGKKKYEAWYAYGRRQSLEINSYKLFFPHICHKPKFVLCRDKEILFYNGVAVISESYNELALLKRILESNIFFDYIRNTTKNYSSNFISLSKNYIKNFGIPTLSIEQRKELLSLCDPKQIDSFVTELYRAANSTLIESIKSRSHLVCVEAENEITIEL